MRATIMFLMLLAQVAGFGQVLHESSRSLGHGFREVTRSVRNPPGHWEGIGHFGYIYYKETLLDQCSSSDFFISPKGQYAIYNNSSTGVVTLFETKTRTTKALTNQSLLDSSFPSLRRMFHMHGKAFSKWPTKRLEYVP
jgi:hypothetical protein